MGRRIFAVLSGHLTKVTEEKSRFCCLNACQSREFRTFFCVRTDKDGQMLQTGRACVH